MPAVKTITEIAVSQQAVLLRTNFDVPLDKQGQVKDQTRLELSLKTINYLLEKRAKIIILSHLGRPQGQIQEAFSLLPVVTILRQLLPQTVIHFSPQTSGITTGLLVAKLQPGEILVLENLRFDQREETNQNDFARELAALGEIYINDCFAASHRQHTSLVALPKLISQKAIGLEFAKEMQLLEKIRNTPKRPLIVILGGKKADKLKIVTALAGWADKLLVGGLLAESVLESPKIIRANLTANKKDITLESVQKFAAVIQTAGTIVWNGTLGVFEEKENAVGTKKIASAIAKSAAYKLAGGGDTEEAISELKLNSKFDFVSSGGGAMLSFLKEGTLPGLEALK